MATIVKQHDKRAGVTYAYESESYWDKEKQQSRSHRRLIGIVDPITNEIKPTTKKKRTTKESDDIAWLKAKRTFFGATYLLDCIGNITGIVDDLKECFPACYDQILSVAYYLVLEDRNPLSRFPKWSKLHNHPHGQVIASQRSSELFAEITENQRMHFFRLQRRRREENEYWAYDTTSISSYSECLRQVCYGKNKDHDPLPQINLALLYGEKSCLPFYYKKLPGNISDVSTVKQLLKDMAFLDCKKIKLVMDRGFYSEYNINELCAERIKFLMGTKLSLKYVQAELEKAINLLHSWENYITNAECYGVTVPIKWKHKRYRPQKKDNVIENRKMYLHFYFDAVKAIDDEQRFAKLMHQLYNELTTGKQEKNHKTKYDKYFEVKINNGVKKIIAKEYAIASSKKDFGYFVLIGNESLSAKDALHTYRNKDVVEKAFDNIKDRLDMRRFNVSSDLSLDGKVFVEFIALIFISYLHKAMYEADLYAKYTMQELFDELEMIECFERQGRKPQIGEVTTKQSNIFKVLNFPPPNSSL